MRLLYPRSERSGSTASAASRPERLVPGPVQTSLEMAHDSLVRGFHGAGLLLVLACFHHRGQAQASLWEKTSPPYTGLGLRLAPVGDVNGDGTPDLVAGASVFPWNASPCCVGKVFFLSGVTGATLLETTGTVPQGYFGLAVAGPGDVTGDGVSDFLVGSVSSEAGLYSGATGSSVFYFLPLAAPVVGTPGDTNWDGVADLLIGNPSYGNGVGLIYSGYDGSLLQSLPTVPGPGCDQLGAAVAGIGDIDGDGAGDVVLGAPNQSCVFPTPRPAQVYSGGAGNLLAVVTGPTGLGSVFGIAVTGLGDVTGDGVPDFAVNGVQWSGGAAVFSGIWVFSGAGYSLVTLLTQTTETLGLSLAGPGDVDGDGVPDLLAGSPNAPPDSTSGPAGRAVLFSGDDWSEIYSIGPPAGEFLDQGWSVCGSDDVDGDGFPELAVGAPGSPYFTTGKVRLYSGAPIGVSSFGTGCAGAPGIPRIGATRSPRIGTAFKINLSGTGPGQGALLLLGFSNTAWWGVPLPLDLGFAGLPGCALAVSPDFALGFTTEPCGPGKGRVVAPMALPALASLVGATFHAQWYVADPGPAPLPGGMTRGLSVVLQP